MNPGMTACSRGRDRFVIILGVWGTAEADTDSVTVEDQ